MTLILNMVMIIWIKVALVILLYKEKQLHKWRLNKKNVTLKDSEPLRLHHALGQKTRNPQVSANCVTPLQFYMVFFASTVVKKVTAETCQCHRKNFE